MQTVSDRRIRSSTQENVTSGNIPKTLSGICACFVFVNCSLALWIFQVFSQDKSIYEAVESAFITLYTRKSPIETAKSLLDLAIDCSIGDLAALESLISSLVSKAEISSSMVHTSVPTKFAFATTLNAIIVKLTEQFHD